jgi:putative transcriptional regulator
MAVKNRLKEILDERGIKQNWLAEKVGVHTGTMTNIVSNKYNTSLEVALKISNILKEPVESIFQLCE